MPQILTLLSVEESIERLGGGGLQEQLIDTHNALGR